MLVLSRKENESILIGNDIKVIISSIGKNGVKIAIDAPKNMTILRDELVQNIKAENTNAAHDVSADELMVLANKFKK